MLTLCQTVGQLNDSAFGTGHDYKWMHSSLGRIEILTDRCRTYKRTDSVLTNIVLGQEAKDD